MAKQTNTHPYTADLANEDLAQKQCRAAAAKRQAERLAALKKAREPKSPAKPKTADK